MVNSNNFRSVAENVAYRFEDRRYSIADEYGDHSYTSHECKLLVYPIIKYTPCGYWIWSNYEMYPIQPREYNPNGNYVTGEKRFVNLQANKKFALPTIDEAYKSYMARKNREISIYQARIRAAEKHKEACRLLILSKVPPSLVPTLQVEMMQGKAPLIR